MNVATPSASSDSSSIHGATRLADWGVIRASGADAPGFLHSQLTQDVTSLPAGQARLAGYCSAKGRLLASFVMWKAESGDVLLACSADLLPAVLKRLSMFVLRAKCKLSDASADMACWGLTGTAAAQALGGRATAEPWAVSESAQATMVRLPDAVADAVADAGATDTGPVARWLAFVAAESDAAARLAAMPGVSADTWAGLEVASGWPRITAATAEQFVPQMINFDLIDGVNFQKGCYPGQEVVARSQYRGTVKRRLFRFASSVAAAPGAEVFHAADATQPAGMVVNVGAWGDTRHAMLVELKLSALDGGTLHLATADGAPMHRLAMPYDVPEPG